MPHDPFTSSGLGDWPRRRSLRSPDGVAIRAAQGTRTYAELATRVDRIAAVLQAGSFRPGSRVAYLGNNHPAFVESMFAAHLIGAIFVPLNTRLAPPEVAFAVNDSGAEVLIFAEELSDLVHEALQGSVNEGLRRIMVEDAAQEATCPGALGAEGLEALIGATSARAASAVVTLDDPALILYTSGTTGNPKGAVLSHGNLTWNAINAVVDYDYTAAEVSLQISPMFHVASLGMGVLPVLLKGGTLILQERLDSSEVLRTIAEYNVTALSGVPTTFQMLAEDPAWDQADLSSLTKLTCGGSAVPLRVLEAYEKRGLAFSGGYGMTEASPGVTAMPAERSLDKVGSSGLPHFFTDIRIADPLGSSLPAGESGEILVSGPNVMSEYWGRQQDTAASFTDQGWFRSGDLGYLDDDGFLYVTGRSKDMIISGGENIYPIEVEQMIMELPQIQSVALVGVADEKWGEVPKAVVVVEPGSSSSLELLQEHLKGRLAKYKIPKHYAEVAQMPRTASGKTRKVDLRGNAHAL